MPAPTEQHDAARALRDVLEAARSAPGDLTIERIGPTGEPEYHKALARRPVAGDRLTLDGSFLPNLIGQDGRIARTPAGRPAGERIRLDALVAAASRVCGFGAALIVAGERDLARADGSAAGIPLLVRQPAELRTVRAAEFLTPSAADADLSTTATIGDIVTAAAVDWASVPVHGFRVRIDRSQRRNVGAEALEGEVVAAVALGIADLVDRLVLDAIIATTPSAFSVAAAAAAGLRAHELRGIVGTNGAGATWADDGTLRAGGVRAELSPAVAATIAGDFRHSGIAIRSEIDLLVERRNVAGAADLTCWIAAAPVVARPGVFWTVPAVVAP